MVPVTKWGKRVAVFWTIVLATTIANQLSPTEVTTTVQSCEDAPQLGMFDNCALIDTSGIDDLRPITIPTHRTYNGIDYLCAEDDCFLPEWFENGAHRLGYRIP